MMFEIISDCSYAVESMEGGEEGEEFARGRFLKKFEVF